MAFDPLARGYSDLAALLRAQVAERSAQIALREGARECSYAELDRYADRVATALQRDGVVAGDTVAFCADSSIEYLGAMFGALRAGAAVVPLAGTAHARDLAAMVADCGARHLLVDAAAARRLQGEPIAAQRIVFDAADDGVALLQWLAPDGVQPAPVAITAAMRFAIIYSSGTTGAPKGIVQSHGMRWAALTAGAALGYTPATVSLVSTPLYSNTTLVGLLPTIAFGGCAVLMRKFEAREFLRLSQLHRVTHAMLVPTQYARLLAVPDFDAFDLSSYQVKLCTSAPFAAGLKAEVLRRWPGQLIELYGLTEGGGICVLLASAFPNKLHTVGKPAPGHDIRIIDEQGRELPRGETGEVVGRSMSMMDGYHGQSQRSAEAEWRDPQGRRYLRSGDIGRYDAEGFLSILDRKKDLIISGGFNIYPGDLEAVLTQHPDVAEAAVIGVPSAQWGETPVAFVVVEPGADLDMEDLCVWANDQLGKTQRIAAIYATDELPRSAIGKLLKQALRERLSAMSATAA